jgi:hypothetical protein
MMLEDGSPPNEVFVAAVALVHVFVAQYGQCKNPFCVSSSFRCSAIVKTLLHGPIMRNSLKDLGCRTRASDLGSSQNMAWVIFLFLAGTWARILAHGLGFFIHFRVEV